MLTLSLSPQDLSLATSVLSALWTPNFPKPTAHSPLAGDPKMWSLCCSLNVHSLNFFCFCEKVQLKTQWKYHQKETHCLWSGPGAAKPSLLGEGHLLPCSGLGSGHIQTGTDCCAQWMVNRCNSLLWDAANCSCHKLLMSWSCSQLLTHSFK